MTATGERTAVLWSVGCLPGRVLKQGAHGWMDGSTGSNVAPDVSIATALLSGLRSALRIIVIIVIIFRDGVLLDFQIVTRKKKRWVHKVEE